MKAAIQNNVLNHHHNYAAVNLGWRSYVDQKAERREHSEVRMIVAGTNAEQSLKLQ